MTEHNRQFDDIEAHVSDRLRRDLRGLFGPPGAVPARIDKAVRDETHKRLARPRRLILHLRWAGIAAAAAAIILAVVLYEAPSPGNLNSQISNLQSSRPAPAERRADVDGIGRVDILDAFRLARCIEARGPVDRKWDVNGDGRVDKADVDLVACAAVRLDQGV
jgi:hypothetical protein